MEKSKNQLATKLKSLEKKMAGKDYSSKVCEMFFLQKMFFLPRLIMKIFIFMF